MQTMKNLFLLTALILSLLTPGPSLGQAVESGTYAAVSVGGPTVHLTAPAYCLTGEQLTALNRLKCPASSGASPPTFEAAFAESVSGKAVSGKAVSTVQAVPAEIFELTSLESLRQELDEILALVKEDRRRVAQGFDASLEAVGDDEVISERTRKRIRKFLSRVRWFEQLLSSLAGLLDIEGNAPSNDPLEERVTIEMKPERIQ